MRGITVYISSIVVDVVELRYLGMKRPRADVLVAVPLRAVLLLCRGRPSWHSVARNPPLMAGLVVPGKAEWGTPPLDQARITTIKGGSLLVMGLQELRNGRNYQSFSQAWWCGVVGTSPHGDAKGASASRLTVKSKPVANFLWLRKLWGIRETGSVGRSLTFAPLPGRCRTWAGPQPTTSRPRFVLNGVEASVRHVAVEDPRHACAHLLCPGVGTFAVDLGDGS